MRRQGFGSGETLFNCNSTTHIYRKGRKYSSQALCLHFDIPFSLFSSLSTLRRHPAHVISYPIIIQQTLNLSDRANRNILIPQPFVRKPRHILGRDGANLLLHLPRTQSPARSDDLAADVFGDGGCPVEREEDGSFELCLGPLDLGFRDGLGQA